MTGPGQNGHDARPVLVVADEACALPPEIARELGVRVAPMKLTVNGKEYEHSPSEGLSHFYRVLLPSLPEPPTTSAPTPADWLSRFQDALEDGRDVLCVAVSSTLSVSYESARVAAEMASSKWPGSRISVLDSKTAAGGEALVVTAAAHGAAKGGLDAAVSRAERARDRVRIIAFLDTLEYVWRGGRVPRAAVWASSLLDLKPVLEYSDDRPVLIARPRTRARATDRLISEMARDVGSHAAHVVVMHAAEPEGADALRARVASEFNCRELFIAPLAPFMGAHTGPGLLGLAYWHEG